MFLLLLISKIFFIYLFFSTKALFCRAIKAKGFIAKEFNCS